MTPRSLEPADRMRWFALIFRFPTGRYHATPWGRHVNEGDVAWPPEPYRLLRSLIATWYRKADHARYDRASLSRLIEALAGADPVFVLPEAVHAHTRHYMPQGRLAGAREDTKLVFDAFFRIDPSDELIITWPELRLEPELFDLAGHLAERIGYLGRAESLVEGTVSAEDIARPYNACPLRDEEIVPGQIAAEVLAPHSAAAYIAARTQMLEVNRDRSGSARRLAFEATLPEALIDALAVETAQLQAAGWSRPPAGRFVIYWRPEVGPQPTGRRRRADDRERDPPKLARLVLAGRPMPRIEDAIKIGEVFRLALMSKLGTPVPVISGRDEDGKPLRDPAHAHAFFLPEDHDGDGQIDHLILYARDGLERSVRRAVEGLTRLWLAERPARHSGDSLSEEETDQERGRREWRLALEGFGDPSMFPDSHLLRCSKTWVSATPYLRPWHAKGASVDSETVRMLEEECRRRGFPAVEAQLLADPEGSRSGRRIPINKDRDQGVLHFHRFRGRRGLVQPDRSGAALRLTFAEPVPGPLAFGFGCHYGLGMFRAY